ncbi:MAG: gliding motility-associated C-terminal domain-containing protein [Bacteroidetes bacterium]|nr:gliding motility-associated C-terminal domain-containing protein [Bacteroidota bacterium]
MYNTTQIAHQSKNRYGFKTSWLVGILLLVVAKVTAQPIPCPPNLDFETGTFQNWDLQIGQATVSTNNPTWQPVGPPVINRQTITSSASPNDQYGGFPALAPGGGTYSIKLGDNTAGSKCERARYYIHIPVSSNNYSFVYKYAFVLEDPGHTITQQPKFVVRPYDSATGDTFACATKTYIAGTAIPGAQQSSLTGPGGSSVTYMAWQSGTMNLSKQAGKTVVVDVQAFDCTPGAHMGMGYFDVISCGTYNAVVAACNLSGPGLTLSAPPGYQSYTWYNANWTQIGTGQILTGITPPNPASFFRVVLVPFFGGLACSDTLVTNPVADVTLKITSDTVCYKPGTPVQLGATIGGGIPPLTIAWTGPGLSCYNCTNPISTTSGNPTYSVRVTDSNNCYRTDSIRFIESHFTMSAGDSFVTCIGTPVQLNAWVKPTIGNYKFKWKPGAGLNNTNILTPTFTPSTKTLGTTTYILTVDSGVCRKVDSITLTTLPNTFSLNDTSVCKGTVFQIAGMGHPAFTYRWTPTIGISDSTVVSPIVQIDTTRSYTVTASYPTCPTIVKSITVDVQPVPVVNAGPDTTKCQWDIFPINVNVSPGWYQKYIYQWSPNPGLSNLNIPNPIFTGQTDGKLLVKVTTPAGCAGQDSLNIKVHLGNFAKVSPADTAICPNNSVPIKITGGKYYQWKPAAFLDSVNSPTPIASPVTDMHYIGYVVDQYGCKDTVYSNIFVHADALIDMPDSIMLYPGEQTQLDPRGNALYYQWWPPVGLSAAPGVNPTTIANPFAAPDVNTRYFLKATTENGCSTTDSIDVIVKSETILDIPNAFSPGSSPNATLKIVRRGDATLKSFRIFNRWGTKVFESQNIDEGWDGKLNGQPQPMGVYVYSIEAVTKNGKPFNKTGNVTLIR